MNIYTTGLYDVDTSRLVLTLNPSISGQHTMTNDRLQALARVHAHHILIRLMPYGVELCRRHEPVIIGLIAWYDLDAVDLDATVAAAIAEHGLGLGFETDPRFTGRRPDAYECGVNWYCGVCHTKLVHQGEHTPACPRACRICGCTDDDCSGCIAATGVPCSWVPGEVDLCSACRDQGLPELIAEVDANEGKVMSDECICPVSIDNENGVCTQCGGLVPSSCLTLVMPKPALVTCSRCGQRGVPAADVGLCHRHQIIACDLYRIPSVVRIP
jgi:hypothetical protein